MKGSPLRNKDEFLEEAVVIAHAGAASVPLDSPLVRESVTEDPAPMHAGSERCSVNGTGVASRSRPVARPP